MNVQSLYFKVYQIHMINLTNNVLVDYLSFDDMAVVILEEEFKQKNKEDRLESSKQVNVLLVGEINGAWF